jgi:two-component system, chemotaxis family, CheB/CheR fusion protein
MMSEGEETGLPSQSAEEDGNHEYESPVKFTVVGIGASAGGLESLERLFTHLPASTGMAYVIVQHLSPDFESLMDTLLAPKTSMPIHRAVDGMELQPDNVYLMPPKKEMIVSGNCLRLSDKDAATGFSLPIDRFFRSLAYEMRKQAVAIVLSGTGSDGSRGVVEVKRHGGLVIVQSSETAKFDGMPRSSLATGAVDQVLSPEDMPYALLRHVAHPLAIFQIHDDKEDSAGMDAIYALLRAEYGIDFTYYRPSTVMRRTERRLSINHAMDLRDYVRQLREDPSELNSLYRDLLIGVTKFFRDPEAFELLGEKVIKRLIETREETDELRIWCAGCATGEEAYSLAILVNEQLEKLNQKNAVKIFATDVHRASLDFASVGVYPEDSLDQLSDERRSRFFRAQGDGFVVAQELRQMIVFAPHNIIRDAPFTRLDLVTCRNLLIYLQPVAQDKAISLFHFGLRAGGYLFLGPSESPSELQPEFETMDEHWKVFRKRRDVRLPTDIRLPNLAGGSGRLTLPSGIPAPRSFSMGRHPAIPLIPFEAILNSCLPPSIVVSDARQVLHVFSGAEAFIRHKGGRPSLDILDMVDAELRIAMSGAIPRALKLNEAVIFRGIRAVTAHGEQRVTLTVKPIPVDRTESPVVLISFESILPVDKDAPLDPTSNINDLSRDRMQSLETELRYTKENLQATIEELETSNEELQATNEELLAANEELQSTNEELHSVNEELYTVNAEYQRKITELTELTDDMENLFSSTEVGTIFLDSDLKIRKFTPQIATAFNLVAQDTGRKLSSFSHRIDDLDINDDLPRVLQEEITIEREVTDRAGHWYLLRILPYRTKGRVDGVIITLVDITKLKETQESLRSVDAKLNGILDNSPTMIFVKDRAGRYLIANRQCKQKFGLISDFAIGKTDHELLPRDVADVVRGNDLLVFDKGESMEFEETVPTASGPRTLLVIKFPLRDRLSQVETIGGVATDITRLKLIEAEQRDALRGRDQFLAMLSHELRNPLAAILNAANLLKLDVEREPVLEPSIGNKISVIDRQSRQMASLLDDLLDVSRITQNKFEIHEAIIDIRSTVEDALQAVTPRTKMREQTIELELADEPLWVRGDETRLQQVQVNLLCNASKYSPPGKRIWLSQQRLGDYVEIRVRDEGNGIPESLLPSIFDMFVQVGDSLDRRDGGMGVGLTLVRSIVGLHGGTIEAKSNGLDRGSEFIIRLPVSGPPEPNRTSTNDPSSIDSQMMASVLLIEDNPDTRRTLAELLSLQGHQVQAVPDGHEALQLLRTTQFDVALIDIGLPGMNGFEIAKAIRHELYQQEVFLIALTGYGQPADRAASADAGFNKHLTKPVAPHELQRLIHQAKKNRNSQ